MNKIAILLTIIFLSIASYIGFTQFAVQKNEAYAKSRQKYNVAIFTPITHPALEEIEQGFTDVLNKKYADKIQFVTFNANGNKTLQRAQAQEIIDGNFDLFFTIGAGCSQLIAQLAQKKQRNTPLVFSAIDDKEFAQELVNIYKKSTGIYIEPNYKKSVEIMRKLKPQAKNVLLVYDPSQGIGLEKDQQKVQHYLKDNGFNVQSVEVFQANEIQQKTASLLSDVDVVFVLIDNTVVSGIDSLITLCNRYGVTLFVSDLNSGEKGAAIAYGIREYDSGALAGQKALQLIAQKNAQQIPISPNDSFKLKINKNSMKEQKLYIDPQLLVKIEQTGSIE